MAVSFIYNLTFLGLAKVALFMNNFYAENQILISHKCVYGALKRLVTICKLLNCQFNVFWVCLIRFLSNSHRKAPHSPKWGEDTSDFGACAFYPSFCNTYSIKTLIENPLFWFFEYQQKTKKNSLNSRKRCIHISLKATKRVSIKNVLVSKMVQFEPFWRLINVCHLLLTLARSTNSFL